MKANFIIGKKQIILASLVLILGIAVYLNWTFSSTNDKLESTQLLQDEEKLTEDVDVPLEETGALPEDKATNAAADDSVDKIAAVNDEKAATTDVTNEVLETDTLVKADENAADSEKSSEAKDEPKTKKMGEALFVNAKIIADDNYFAKAQLARDKSRDASIQTISTILDDEKLTEADKKTATDKAMNITDAIETENNIENLIKAKGFSDCMAYISKDNATIVVKTEGLNQDKATQIKNIVATEAKIKGENISISEIR